MHTCPVGRYTKTFGRLTKVPGDFLPALGGLAEAMGKPAKPVGTLAWLLGSETFCQSAFPERLCVSSEDTSSCPERKGKAHGRQGEAPD